MKTQSILTNTNKAMKTIKKISIIAIVMLVALPLFAQEKSLKRKVAIGRFSNETQYAKSVFYEKENDPMGKQASDILTTKLAQSEKFLLIELKETEELTGNYTTQKVGADYLIIGSITEYGRKNIGTQGFLSEKKEQIVEVGVSIRLVDVSTGIIIYSEEAKGEATATDKQVLGFGKNAGFDATLSDKAITAAISKLVENIINKCQSSEWKAYIISSDEGQYIISGGASQGIAAGDKYVVMQKGKKVKNPQTGIMIELPGKQVAEIEITATIDGATAETELSYAKLVTGTINEGEFENYYITEKK